MSRGELGCELGGQCSGAVAHRGQPGAVCRAVGGEGGDDQEPARIHRGRGQGNVGRAVGRATTQSTPRPAAARSAR
jgi:hypothetical protein